MGKWIILSFLSLAILFTQANSAYSISASEKSQDDYVLLLYHIRNVQVMINNFANEDQKKKYAEISADFRTASVDFYAHNFTYYDEESKKHRIKFYGVKHKLVSLLDDIAKVYIDRSDNLLKQASNSSFNILIKFTKGGYAKYFNRAVNPLAVLQHHKIYKTEEYHLYRDKNTIEDYLRRGYKVLQDAKRTYADPDLQILKEKKERSPQDLNFMLTKYYAVISQCRDAKVCGIEIFKIINLNNLMTVRRKLEAVEISPSNPEPIFDVRIPEDFKVDANDNIFLVHSHEMKKLPADFPKSPATTTEHSNGTQGQETRKN
jgi:hypothetical protein